MLFSITVCLRMMQPPFHAACIGTETMWHISEELDWLMTLLTDISNRLLSAAIKELFYRSRSCPNLLTNFLIGAACLKHFYRFILLRFCHCVTLHFIENSGFFPDAAFCKRGRNTATAFVESQGV